MPHDTRSTGRFAVSSFRGVSVALESLADRIDEVAPHGSGGGRTPVDDLDALRAIPELERSDQDTRLVESEKSIYRFDAQGTAADDGDLVIAPTVGTGRWFKVTGGTGLITDQVFTPTLGQTVFTLSDIYAPGGFKLVALNGVVQLPSDFTISGTTFTWTGSYVMDPTTDLLCVFYQKALP